MACILSLGIATLDIVNELDHFPAEDSEVRALARRMVRGGNAANSAVVLSGLGHDVSWAGMLADDADARLIRDDLRACGVACNLAIVQHGGSTPVSYVLLNRANGSRSIVHYRDLQEFTAQAFANIPLDDFDWLHFEGRAVDELEQMLQRARALQARPVSLEVEKPRVGIERLFSLVDVLLFSRDYAKHCGYDNASDFLRDRVPDGLLATCAWGRSGAWVIDQKRQLWHAPAQTAEPVVDTLGAGDVFNGAFIHACLNNLPIAQRVETACRLAGQKCTQRGFTGLIMKDTEYV